MEKFVIMHGRYPTNPSLGLKINELIDQQRKDRGDFEALIAGLIEEKEELEGRVEYLENELSTMKCNALPDSEKYMPYL